VIVSWTMFCLLPTRCLFLWLYYKACRCAKNLLR